MRPSYREPPERSIPPLPECSGLCYNDRIMKACLDCIPCLLKTGLSAIRISEKKEEKQRELLNGIAAFLPRIPPEASPPEIAGLILERIRKSGGITDPYKKIKQRSNEATLALYPALQKRILQARNPFGESLALAIAGNLIDYMACTDLDLPQTLKQIQNLPLFQALEANHPLEGPHFHYNALKAAIQKAPSILYLADNAGEILFDRLFIEQIHRDYPQKEVFFAVRGGPAGNDALLEDAEFCGLKGCSKIMDSGSTAPGTIIKLCSKAFLKKLNTAGIVISKGQGNFESLYNTPYLEKRQNPTFFLFMIKCPVIARNVGGEEGQAVLIH